GAILRHRFPRANVGVSAARRIHLSYSCAPPILTAALVTHDPLRSWTARTDCDAAIVSPLHASPDILFPSALMRWSREATRISHLCRRRSTRMAAWRKGPATRPDGARRRAFDTCPPTIQRGRPALQRIGRPCNG